MKMKAKVMKDLALVYEKKDKTKSILFILVFAFLMSCLFCVVYLSHSRLLIEKVSVVRKEGTSATAFLEYVKEPEYERIKELLYIKEVGLSSDFAIWEVSNQKSMHCVSMDEKGYEVFKNPAFTELVGRHPKKAKEIMLSREGLKLIGKGDAKIGEKIQVSLSSNDGELQTTEMTLSGIYSEYANNKTDIPTAYFSQEFLTLKNYPSFPSNIMLIANPNLDVDLLETMLREDVKGLEESTQYTAYGSVQSRAVDNVIGGYGSAIIIAILILYSGYLFLYNFLSMSLSEEIKQYGLLQILGCTRKQIKQMIRVRFFRQLSYGVFMGLAVSCVMGVIVFPKIVSALFLKQYKTIGDIELFDIRMVLLILLVVVLMAWLARCKVNRKIMDLSVMSSCTYTGVVAPKIRRVGKEKRSRNRNMAWRNVVSSVNFKSTIVVLFIWVMVVMGVSVIIGGFDEIYHLKQNPDFIISASKKNLQEWHENWLYNGYGELLDAKLLREISEINKNNEMKIDMLYAGDPGSAPRLFEVKTDRPGVIEVTAFYAILDEKEIESLERYVENNGRNINIEQIKNGDGAVFLFDHEISPKQEKEADKTIGETVFSDDYPLYDLYEFVRAGYIDIYYAKGLKLGIPKPNFSKRSVPYSYLLINEKAFKKLEDCNMLYGIAQLDIRVDEKDEEMVKGQLLKIVGDSTLVCNSDVIEQAWGTIKANRLLMGIVSGALLVIGILNYICVIIVNISVRRQIFHTMESVGMTRKQLKKMLIAEGAYYACFTYLAVFILGVPLLYGVGRVLSTYHDYFTFGLPWGLFVGMFAFLMGICIMIPLVIYRKGETSASLESKRHS